MTYANIDGVMVARFENILGDDVVQVITPDGNRWFYINGEWVLHN